MNLPFEVVLLLCKKKEGKKNTLAYRAPFVIVSNDWNHLFYYSQTIHFVTNVASATLLQWLESRPYVTQHPWSVRRSRYRDTPQIGSLVKRRTTPKNASLSPVRSVARGRLDAMRLSQHVRFVPRPGRCVNTEALKCLKGTRKYFFHLSPLAGIAWRLQVNEPAYCNCAGKIIAKDDSVYPLSRASLSMLTVPLVPKHILYKILIMSSSLV